ncbi:hypothetical protein OC861_004734 [Tilletia horrida]|nr:hypothetical protein OC861_004734 [Tilletia horrida]
MYLLGAHLPDHKLVHIALRNFLGISHHTARRLCARLQLHESAKVSSLTEAQINQLSAFLSSPSSIPARPAAPTVPVPFTLYASRKLSEASSSSSSSSSAPSPAPRKSAASGTSAGTGLPPSQRPSPSSDPLRSLVLEADLRRQIRANIAHHRMVGSYVGRRHAAGLPVRGQRTRSNAQTARKLNRLERRAYSTASHPTYSAPSSSMSTSRGTGRSPAFSMTGLLSALSWR